MLRLEESSQTHRLKFLKGPAHSRCVSAAYLPTNNETETNIPRFHVIMPGALRHLRGDSLYSEPLNAYMQWHTGAAMIIELSPSLSCSQARFLCEGFQCRGVVVLEKQPQHQCVSLPKLHTCTYACICELFMCDSHAVTECVHLISQGGGGFLLPWKPLHLLSTIPSASEGPYQYT